MNGRRKNLVAAAAVAAAVVALAGSASAELGTPRELNDRMKSDFLNNPDIVGANHQAMYLDGGDLRKWVGVLALLPGGVMRLPFDRPWTLPGIQAPVND